MPAIKRCHHCGCKPRLSSTGAYTCQQDSHTIAGPDRDSDGAGWNRLMDEMAERTRAADEARDALEAVKTLTELGEMVTLSASKQRGLFVCCRWQKDSRGPSFHSIDLFVESTPNAAMLAMKHHSK